MPVIECDAEAAREALEAAGVELEGGNTDHERWRASAGGGTAVAYDGKVVIQGEDPGRLEGLLRGSEGRVHVYCDGASRGNPGPAAIGWVLVTADGIVTEGGRRIGETTSNRAEYEGLIHALGVGANFGFDEVDVRSDSELVVNQVRGEWDVNNPRLREYRVEALERLGQFETWSLRHVPREINDRADERATEALENV